MSSEIATYYIKPPRTLIFPQAMRVVTRIASDLSCFDQITGVELVGSLARALRGRWPNRTVPGAQPLFGDIDLNVVSDAAWEIFGGHLREATSLNRQATKYMRLQWAYESLQAVTGFHVPSDLSDHPSQRRLDLWSRRLDLDGDLTEVPLIDIHVFPKDWRASRFDEVVTALGSKYVTGSRALGSLECHTWDPRGFLEHMAQDVVSFDRDDECFQVLPDPAVGAASPGLK